MQRRMARDDIGGLRPLEECPHDNKFLAPGGASKFSPVHESKISLDVIRTNCFQVANSGLLQVFEKVLGVFAISNSAAISQISSGHVLRLESRKCISQGSTELRFVCHWGNGAVWHFDLTASNHGCANSYQANSRAQTHAKLRRTQVRRNLLNGAFRRLPEPHLGEPVPGSQATAVIGRDNFAPY